MMSSPSNKAIKDMVPCHVCGADVGAGWVYGFSPSPLTLKLGLCDAHDTQANRNRAIAAWQALMLDAIARMTRQEAKKVEPSRLWQLEIHFVEGGSALVECQSCTATDETLQILMRDQSLRFYPLRQIREYSLRPLSAAGSTAS